MKQLVLLDQNFYIFSQDPVLLTDFLNFLVKLIAFFHAMFCLLEFYLCRFLLFHSSGWHPYLTYTQAHTNKEQEENYFLYLQRSILSMTKKDKLASDSQAVRWLSGEDNLLCKLKDLSVHIQHQHKKKKRKKSGGRAWWACNPSTLLEGAGRQRQRSLGVDASQRSQTQRAPDSVRDPVLRDYGSEWQSWTPANPNDIYSNVHWETLICNQTALGSTVAKNANPERTELGRNGSTLTVLLQLRALFASAKWKSQRH